MGRRAHCEVFKEAHSRLLFFQKTLPSPALQETLPSLPSRGKESLASISLEIALPSGGELEGSYSSPLLRGVRRGLKKMIKYVRLLQSLPLIFV